MDKAANPARNQNTDRQPHTASSQPPITGAMAGAMANTKVTFDMTFCARAPENKSRTSARPITTPAPAAMPCPIRAQISSVKSRASAAPMEASTYTASATSTMRRRPQASDNGPCTSIMPPKNHR